MKIKILSICVILISIVSIYQLTRKTDYIESINLIENNNIKFEINEDTNANEQEFQIPYDVFWGLDFFFQNDENQPYFEMIIKDKTTNQEIVSQEFQANQKKEHLYEILLKTPIKANPEHQYSVQLKQNGELIQNNRIFYTTLYGGESRGFWNIFAFFCVMYVSFFVVHINYLQKHQKSIRQNTLVQAGILGILTFLMMLPFSKCNTFIDETEYIMGGLYLFRGNNMYTDFYNQHTPVFYFITAFFHIFNAYSEQQFRICFYVFLSLIYMGLYQRHKKQFGKAMFFLPICLIAFQALIPWEDTIRVIAENLQAICMVALLLEFLSYLKDECLDWKRSLLVSLCLVGGIGSVFICVYEVFAIFLGVLIKEIGYWRKNTIKISWKCLLKRYYKLLIACIIPVLLFLIYLIMTHSLGEFYKQAFQFNREVYSNYQISVTHPDFGKSIWKPFWFGIHNFITIIPTIKLNFDINYDTIFSVAQIITILYFCYVMFSELKQKKWLQVATTLLFVILGFVRTNIDFHTMAAWATIVTSIVIYLSGKELKSNFITYAVFEVILILVFYQYIIDVDFRLKFPEQVVPSTEQKIVAETTEEEKIFVDLFSISRPLYLTYKNRIILNKCWCIYPWYMEWYQEDCVKDLAEEKPNMVVYSKDIENIAGNVGFAEEFRAYLQEHYEPSKIEPTIWYLMNKKEGEKNES